MTKYIFKPISWWCIIKGGGPYLHFSFDWFIVVRGGNYCVINFVSHVEIVVIKIQSNNLNTTSTTTKYDKQDPTEGEIMMKILPLNNLFCQFGSLTSLNFKQSFIIKQLQLYHINFKGSF